VLYYPAVFWASLSYGVTLGWIVLQQTANSSTFPEMYHFSNLGVGNLNIAVGVLRLAIQCYFVLTSSTDSHRCGDWLYSGRSGVRLACSSDCETRRRDVSTRKAAYRCRSAFHHWADWSYVMGCWITASSSLVRCGNRLRNLLCCALHGSRDRHHVCRRLLQATGWRNVDWYDGGQKHVRFWTQFRRNFLDRTRWLPEGTSNSLIRRSRNWLIICSVKASGFMTLIEGVVFLATILLYVYGEQLRNWTLKGDEVESGIPEVVNTEIAS